LFPCTKEELRVMGYRDNSLQPGDMNVSKHEKEYNSRNDQKILEMQRERI
jgi:hypothetical protein